MGVSHTSEMFIEKASIKHNNFYSYNKTIYTKSRDKVIITCPIHGDFLIKANGHLNGSGCQKCGRKRIIESMFYTEKEFIDKANLIHNFKYNYDKVVYVTSKIKVQITCDIHNIFEQEPRSHLQGQGCPMCNMYQGYNRSRWIEYNKDKEGIFYVLNCYNEKENFFKIGITGKSVKKRYRYNRDMPYKYEIVKEVKSFDLKYIWDLEKQEKNRLKDYKYKPEIIFSGSSNECFKIY